MLPEKTFSLAAALTYRPYKPSDVTQLLALWTEHTKFGVLTEASFRDWFVANPYGGCEIMVAVDKDEQIISQMIFIPTRMVVEGREIKAFRIAAPILHKDFRFTGTDFSQHPVLSLYNAGMTLMKQKGFTLAYIFPAPGWSRLLRTTSENRPHWETSSFDTFSVSLEAAGTHQFLITEEVTFSPGSAFTEEYDALWEEAVHTFPVSCGIVRRKEWLQYRLSSCYVIEARDQEYGSLIGYCAVKKDSGLLMDMLAKKKEDLKNVFWGTVQFVHHLNPGRLALPIREIKGMYSPLIMDIIPPNIVQLVDYRFHFGCCVLDEGVQTNQVKATQWYMMPDVQ